MTAADIPSSEGDLKGLEVGYILLTKVTTSRIAKDGSSPFSCWKRIKLEPISRSLEVELYSVHLSSTQAKSGYLWLHLPE